MPEVSLPEPVRLDAERDRPTCYPTNCERCGARGIDFFGVQFLCGACRERELWKLLVEQYPYVD